jgi:hypothetical protein
LEAGTEPEPGPSPGPGPGPEPDPASGWVAEACRNGTKSGAEAGPEPIQQVAFDEEVMAESPAPTTSISSPAGTKSAGDEMGGEIGSPRALPAPRTLPRPVAAPAADPAAEPEPVAPVPVPVPDQSDPIAREGAESPVARGEPPESGAGQTPAGECRPWPRYRPCRPPRGEPGLRTGNDHYPCDD